MRGCRGNKGSYTMKSSADPAVEHPPPIRHWKYINFITSVIYPSMLIYKNK